MRDLLAPPAATPPPAAPPADPNAGGGQAPPAAPTNPPAAAPTLSRELPENWFLAGGDAFAAESETLSRFKSVDDLAKSYIHLRKTGPSYPGQTATPEEIERFRALAQVPPSPDAYGVQPPADLPEGMQWDGETLKSFAEIAHKNHVPAPAFKALIDQFTQLESQKLQAMQQQEEREFQQVQQEIQSILGPNQLEYDRNVARINHTVALLADKANIAPDDPSLAAIRGNAAMIRILHQVAKMTAEDPTHAPAGYGDLRSDYDKGMDIINGKDPEWSQKYRENDKTAIERVARLLDSKKRK